MRWFYLETFTFFSETLTRTFHDMGIPCETPQFSPEQGTSEQLMQALEAFKPDIILTSGWTSWHKRKYLDVVKRYCQEQEAFHVFWSLEDPVHTELWSKYMIEQATPDYVVTHEYGFEAFYHQLGIPAGYLPLACYPTLHHSRPLEANYQADIALVGNYSPILPELCPFRYAGLKRLVDPLLKQQEYSFHIYGAGWRDYIKNISSLSSKLVVHGTIPYQEIPSVYSSSKLTIGIQNSPQLLTRRTFEAMGSGTCLLTLNTPAVSRHFISDQHLVTIDEDESVLDKVGKYLRDSAARERIKAQGQRFVHQQHTYQERLLDLIEQIKPHVQAKRNGKKLFALPQELYREVRRAKQVTVNQRHHVRPEIIQLKTSSQRPLEEVFLKFAMEPVKGYRIKQARCTLFANKRMSGQAEVECYQVLSDWDNNSLKTGKRPKLSAEPIGVVPLKHMFSSKYPWVSNWYRFDMTKVGRDWEEHPDQNYGLYFVLRSDKSDKVSFVSSGSKDGFNRMIYGERFLPRLECTYQKISNAVEEEAWCPFID
ncbi:hypothetical protein GCM10011391_20540 [Pullulanibacillus camelliae]|uniref:DUF3880 domain-containing protein n=1 Tax=Pullulanibacillus camelliae TaxID=1707096 RepID=A0A8J2YH85_9BACL|nr:glycosyltransferase [Pullulanibacillus camelliae]GGE41677.1 hypothetical protein GCM10011391_20540 [Pullulanibacillus camelliae]